MADEPLSEHHQALLRETAKLMGMLLIGRTDTYAIHTGSQWVTKRKKLTLGDFRQHLFGNRCLGTYMLNPDSQVRAVVFDVDLKKEDAPYIEISDTNSDDTIGDTDLEVFTGNLEAALHDETHSGHRWARTILLDAVANLMRETHNVTGLHALPVITGGGAHVIVSMGGLVPAAEARAMAHSIMDVIPTFTRKSESFYSNSETSPSLDIEVFPKQDELTDPESLGNLIRLPFGKHESGIRTYALDPALPVLPSWSLNKTSSIDALRLAATMVDLEWELLSQ